MLTKMLFLGLMVTFLMEEASTELQIIAVNFIKTDPDFINYTLSSITVHRSLPTISVVLGMIRAFPKQARFDVQMIEEPPGDVLIQIGNYSTPICDFEATSRVNLPFYIQKLTSVGDCGISGIFTEEIAGLYKFTIPLKMRSVPYPIVNANEIVDGQRTILKYDVILNNPQFQEFNIMNPRRSDFVASSKKRARYFYEQRTKHN